MRKTPTRRDCPRFSSGRLSDVTAKPIWSYLSLLSFPSLLSRPTFYYFLVAMDFRRQSGTMFREFWATMRLLIAYLAVFSSAATGLATDESVPITLWTTGSALMPGWGLYPNGERYGGR